MKIFADLTNNICGIFRKFVDDGKCTISFKLPEIDLQIKADCIQLKAFLNVMKNELCPNSQKESSKDDSNNNKLLRAFSSTSKMITEVTKLTITQRSEFPSKGFPRTLKELHINEVGCLQMPIGILNLTNLTFLNLSNNQISKVHKSLGNLKLTQLIISNNKLGEGNIIDWQWLNGKNLQSSIQLINLSGNNLKGIPSTIACCENLVTLNLSSNDIEKIPFAIRQLTKLRHLNLSHNKLSALPCTFKQLYLSHVDLSGNQFPTSDEANNKLERSRWVLNQLGAAGAKFPTLFELSSRSLNHKTNYMHLNIPKIIKEVLFFSPICARCHNFCFDRYIFQDILKIPLKSGSRVTDNNESEFLVYGPLCSSNCYGIK
jgi:LRR-repeat protein 1